MKRLVSTYGEKQLLLADEAATWTQMYSVNGGTKLQVSLLSCLYFAKKVTVVLSMTPLSCYPNLLLLSWEPLT